MKQLKSLWHWLFDPLPAWIKEISEMNSTDEVRDALEDPDWREKHGLSDPFTTKLREECVSAAGRRIMKRRRHRLLLNRISGMVVFGGWILAFEHFNPGVQFPWIAGTVIVGAIGMVIYSYGD